MIPVLDFIVILILFAGIWLFRKPHQAKLGNLVAAFALLAAFVLVLFRDRIMDTGTVSISLLCGAIVGYILAKKIDMIQIPAMVALQNGTGGLAALLVSVVELMRSGVTVDPIKGTSGVIGLVIGALTFSGSMVASARLANKIRQAPRSLPANHFLSAITIGAMLVVVVALFLVPEQAAWYLYLVLITLALIIGVLISIRVGGADMPVMISFLNSMTGLAAALCGMVSGNRLLIVFGATVAASGTILTYLMCKAMNRYLLSVLFPVPAKADNTLEIHPSTASASLFASASENSPASSINPFDRAVHLLENAQTIIFVPGYGMALAKAQTEVAKLAEQLIVKGKNVRYAIHPVAGRMPGHMNVLLAEAGVDYDMLVEMDEINSEFKDTDLVLVVGACDVVNPAAIDVEGTPISGMPVLMVHQSKHVVCCNFDEKPGYSGVNNPLYERNNTLLLPGDAKSTVHQLVSAL